MATPPSLLQIAFAAGIDESQQDEVLDPTAAFAVLQNVRQDKRGALVKRLGFGLLPLARLDDTNRAAGNRVISHKDVIATIDGEELDAYSEDLNLWTVAGRVPEASVTTRTLSTVSGGNSSGSYVGHLDTARCGNYLVTATMRPNTSLMASVETVDGTVVRQPEVVATTSSVAVNAALGVYSTYVILLYADLNTANVVAYYLNTASAATITAGWQSIGNVATDKATPSLNGQSTALSVVSLTNRVAFVYVNNSGGAGADVTVKTMTYTGVVDYITVATSGTPNVVAAEGSIADTLWIAWGDGTSVKVIGLDADDLSTTLATTATVITCTSAPVSKNNIGIVSSSTAGAGCLVVNDGDGYTLRAAGFTTSGGAVTPSSAVTVYGVYLDGRPFRYDGRYYGPFRSGNNALDTNSLGSTVLCDFTDTTTSTKTWLRPVASASPFVTVGSFHRNQQAISLSATSVAVPVRVRRSSFGDAPELVTYDFADRKRWRSASHNGSLYLAGGLLSYFDGTRVVEAMPVHAPRAPTCAANAGGTSLTGTFRYVATYEEMDDDGNWVLGSVSSPTEISVTSKDIDVSTVPLSMTSRLTPTASSAEKRVRVCFYRTTNTGEPPYYYLTELANVPTGVVSFTDTTADATIAVNRTLYGTGALPGTNGSAQDRRCPPFCADVVSYNGMLVIASGSTIWYSGQTVDGEATWFSPAFTLPIPDEGNVTALATQDGALYAFKRGSIFATSGDPPSDNGSSGGLGTPRRLAVDVGCIDPCSVVVTSLGIFFQSDRGIELLTRGGAVTWIGEQVQTTLASYPVVSSAVLDTRSSLVRFTLAASESGGRVSGNGRDLVYDLSVQAWISVDARSNDTSMQDACMVYYGGSYRYAMLDVNGYVHAENDSNDAGAYLDPSSTWITMRAETAWFKPAGLQGRFAISTTMLLARKVTDVDVSIFYGYNYATSYKSSNRWTYSAINTLLSDGWPVTQLRHNPHDDAECQAIRIKIEDSTSGGTVGTGQGTKWIGLTLDVTPQQGTFDVPEGAV